ncbi:MAG: hypothetical protein LBE11_00820 [Prevotellaceae bacterium]|jgi:hypothetical protein|nr:hypothetical protein [Prevotellaceae bacterium]
MKQIMNKIIVVFVAVFLCNNIFAQSEAKNTVRAGAGVIIRDNADGSKYRMEPAMGVEYQYSF